MLSAAALTATAFAADDDPLTLEEAIAQAAKRESAFSRDDLEPVRQKLLEHQSKLGPFDAATVKTRTKYLGLLDRRDELLRDEGNLLTLRRSLPKDGKARKTFQRWLEEAKPKAPTLPKSDSPPLKPYDYSAIDKKMADVPKSAEKSIKALGDYVKKVAKNDREKARAIVKWMLDHVAYDVDALTSGKSPALSPAAVFKTRATVCQGQASLFEAVGKAAGLEVFTIAGNHRSTTINPLLRRITALTPSGLTYTPHAWNAVRIDKRWYLVDVTHQNYRKKKGGRVEVEAEPSWSSFLAPPEWRICNFRPVDEKHQLLKTPLALADQERLPLLSEAAFAYGVKPISHPGPFADARDELVMTFEAPRDVWFHVAFEGEKGRTSDAPAYTLRRDGDTVRLRLHFAKAGACDLLLLAKKRDDKSDRSDLVARYRVEAKAGKGKASLPELASVGQEQGARALFPRTRTLKAGEKVQFLVHLPKATKAAVYCAATKEWFDLKGKDGFFAGEVKPSAGEVIVAANCPGDKEDALEAMIVYAAE
jgi:hypothetical protein